MRMYTNLAERRKVNKGLQNKAISRVYPHCLYTIRFPL